MSWWLIAAIAVGGDMAIDMLDEWLWRREMRRRWERDHDD